MSLTRKRSVSWSRYYELKLFDLWEKYIAEMRPQADFRMKDMHIMMAKSLDEAGFIGIEWQAVRTKLDNLTRKYRMEAKEPVSTWIHFKRMHKILKYWKPEKAVNSVDQCPDDIKDITNEDEETQYLSEYLDGSASCNSEVIKKELNDASWEHSMDMLSNSGILNDEPKPPPKRRRKAAAQDEMTAFEAGMLEATRERNEELRKMREEITNFGRRRLDIMERLEKTLSRIEEANGKFHQQMLKKKS